MLSEQNGWTRYVQLLLYHISGYFGNIFYFNEYYNSKLWVFKISLIFFLQRTTDLYPMILWNLLSYEKTVGFAINPLPPPPPPSLPSGVSCN